MKTLSVQQPWAWLIVNGYKDVENRGWKLPKWFHALRRIQIHASQNPVPKEDWRYVASCVARSQFANVPELVKIANDRKGTIAWLRSLGQFSAIIGEVDIVDCVESNGSPWFIGRFGFLLENPTTLPVPIESRGYSYFWNYPGPQ